jgi:hypothetical protein
MNNGRAAYIQYEQGSLRSSLPDIQTNSAMSHMTSHFYNPAMYDHIQYARQTLLQ